MTHHPKVWLSPNEAAEYLSMSRDSIERRMVPASDFEPPKGAGVPPVGKLRFHRVTDWDAKKKPVRVLGEDVYRLLPLPRRVENDVIDG